MSRIRKFKDLADAVSQFLEEEKGGRIESTPALETVFAVMETLEDLDYESLKHCMETEKMLRDWVRDEMGIMPTSLFEALSEIRRKQAYTYAAHDKLEKENDELKNENEILNSLFEVVEKFVFVANALKEDHPKISNELLYIMKRKLIEMRSALHV